MIRWKHFLRFKMGIWLLVNYHHKGPLMHSFRYFFFVISLNKLLNKQFSCRRFKIYSYDITVMQLSCHWYVAPWYSNEATLSLKQKCLHFNEIFITDCTGSCHLTTSSAVNDENSIKMMLCSFLFQASSLTFEARFVILGGLLAARFVALLHLLRHLDAEFVAHLEGLAHSSHHAHGLTL